MKLFRIMFILLFLVMSMGIVSAQDNLNDTMQVDVLAGDDVGSFEELENDIINANGTLEITKDYRNDNYSDGIVIERGDLVINGNGHTLDGNNQRIFLINASNITINNLIFTNAHHDRGGGAIRSYGTVTLNNVTFIDNHADIGGGAIANFGVMDLNNVTFVDNGADIGGGALFNDKGIMTLHDTVFIGGSSDYGGAIFSQLDGVVNLSDVVFINNSASYCGGAIAALSCAIDLDDVVFINSGASESGGAIYVQRSVMDLSDVVFINNSASYDGGALAVWNSAVGFRGADFINCIAPWYGGAITAVNSVVDLCDAVFINSSAYRGGAINLEGNELIISNAFFSSGISDKYGQIYCRDSNIDIDNSTFLNITSSYSPAICIQLSNCSISNSRFVNLTADISAGAVSIDDGGNHYIEGCEFINVSSSKNGGALNIDIPGQYGDNVGNVTILDTLFEATYSDFGGALIQVGGNLLVNNSNFINNGATYKGGSVYISYVDDAEIDNCTFDSNGFKAFENITACGSAIYCDMSNLTLINSRVINKSRDSGSAVYACDSSYAITNSIFMDNTNAIYTDFDKTSNLVNNVYNNGSVSTNNTFVLETIMVGEGMELKLLNNSINVTNLPSRFDLHDWNWTSPVGDQGLAGACWAFAATEVLESALRKACGITTDFSVNNMHKTMIRYSDYGVSFTGEGGNNGMVASYLLSWFGAFPQDYDTFDEFGKISRVIKTGEDIHIQDVMFVFNDEPGSPQMKSAILKYGSLGLGILQGYEVSGGQYFNPETNAQYVSDNISFNHMVEAVGWDDNYPKENFLITPPGDGAWICKNSAGTDWGDNGYFYVSYYDKSLFSIYLGGDDNLTLEDFALEVIVENLIPYNKNYQYDIGQLYFDLCENVSYTSIFEALDDDLIAAVGTYFNDSNVDYRVDVYVNGELKLSQEGSSPYAGFHTIKLDDYVPIKEGDVFSAVMTSNSLPFIDLNETRIHYTPGLSYKVENGSWVDLYYDGMIACLKVYTVADDRHNATFIAPDRIIGVNDAIYGYDYQFILKDENGTALADQKVIVSFNGENQAVVADENGWGTVTVKADTEGLYAVELIFKGSNDYYAVSQNATIKLVRQKTVFVAPDRVVYVRDISKGYEYSAILKDNYGKALINKKVLFIFNGKKQVAYTDENGWATVTLKADTAGTQTVTIKFAGDRCYQETSIIKTVKVVRESSILTTANKAFVVSNNDKKVTATLKSKSGNPIYCAKVTFTVGGKEYSATTDDVGVATFSIDLFKLGTFHAVTRFEDSRFYAATVTESKVIIY